MVPFGKYRLMVPFDGFLFMAGGLGFEPRLHDPESCVLPLHHPPMLSTKNNPIRVTSVYSARKAAASPARFSAQGTIPQLRQLKVKNEKLKV